MNAVFIFVVLLGALLCAFVAFLTIKILSIEYVWQCGKCHHEIHRYVAVTSPIPPTLPCPACGGSAVLVRSG